MNIKEKARYAMGYEADKFNKETGFDVKMTKTKDYILRAIERGKIKEIPIDMSGLVVGAEILHEKGIFSNINYDFESTFPIDPMFDEKILDKYIRKNPKLKNMIETEEEKIKIEHEKIFSYIR